MSSDNAQSAVTYTSISSNLDGPSWGIPLMNVGELPEIDPYEEVTQQGQAHPLSHAYVPDPMELDEHVPVYVLSQNTRSFMHHQMIIFRLRMTMKIPRRILVRSMSPRMTMRIPRRIPIRSMSLRMRILRSPLRALIDAFASGSSPFLLPPSSPAYDQAQLGRRAAMIRMRDDILEEDMPPRRRFALTGPPPGGDVAESSVAAARAPRSQYNFVDTVEAGQGLIRSPSHDTRTIARAADRVGDVGYVRALQASERRMMTSIEETLETHMSRIEWQRQRAEDLAVTQMMRIHTLEARARADMVEDVDSSC
nr:hypothetical protein [Tanacetum cinerariifolium]